MVTLNNCLKIISILLFVFIILKYVIVINLVEAVILSCIITVSVILIENLLIDNNKNKNNIPKDCDNCKLDIKKSNDDNIIILPSKENKSLFLNEEFTKVDSVDEDYEYKCYKTKKENFIINNEPSTNSELVPFSNAVSVPPTNDVAATSANAVANTAYIPPDNTAYIPPANAAYVPPANAVYVPPANAVYVPPANAVYVPPANAVYVPPANAAYIPPANAVAVPPANAVAVPPANAVAVPPANAVAVPPANAVAVPPANAVAVPPANAAYIPPANAVAVPPANAVAVPPANAVAVPPANAVAVPPANAVAVPPANAVQTQSNTTQPSIENFNLLNNEQEQEEKLLKIESETPIKKNKVNKKLDDYINDSMDYKGGNTFDLNSVEYQQDGQQNDENQKVLKNNLFRMSVGNRNVVNNFIESGGKYYGDILTRSTNAPSKFQAATNELKYGDFNYIAPLNKGMINPEYTFVSPSNWYPIPPHPPVCVTNKSCTTCPIIMGDGKDYMQFASLEDFDKSRRFTGDMNINVDYIKNVLNNPNGY